MFDNAYSVGERSIFNNLRGEERHGALTFRVAGIIMHRHRSCRFRADRIPAWTAYDQAVTQADHVILEALVELLRASCISGGSITHHQFRRLFTPTARLGLEDRTHLTIYCTDCLHDSPSLRLTRSSGARKTLFRTPVDMHDARHTSL
jgi:hypothetical protein